MKKIIILGLMLVLCLGLVNADTISFTGDSPVNDSFTDSFVVNTSVSTTEHSMGFLEVNKDLVLWYDGTLNASGHPIDKSSYSFESFIDTPTIYTSTDAVFGQSIYSNVSDYSEINVNTISNDNGSKLYPEEGDMTYSFWIKTDNSTSTAQSIIRTTAALEHDDVLEVRLLPSGNLRVHMSAETGNFYEDYTTDLANNVWNHIGIVYGGASSNTVKVHVNGIKLTPEIDIPEGTNLTYGRFKMFHSDNKYDGLLDEMVIIKRALNPEEILALKNITANGLNTNLTDTVSSGGETTYSAYLKKNDTSYITETRNFIYDEGISINSPTEIQNNNLFLNISLSLGDTCYATFDGNNISLIKDGSTFYNTYDISSYENGKYSVFYECSTEQGSTTNISTDFYISDHNIYFVDKNNPSCTDAGTGKYNYPFCSIDSALNEVENPGEEVVIMYGNYNTVIDTNELSVHGTSENPIILRGESNNKRTIINGSEQGSGDVISASSRDYVIFRYFRIVEAPNDAMNIHGDENISGYNPKGVLFENITAYQNGRLGENVSLGPAGDSISFHEYSSGGGSNLRLIEGYKSGITDVHGTKTNYTNLYIEGAEDYGIWFYVLSESKYDFDEAYHYVENAVINNTPQCILVESPSDFKNLWCEDNGLGKHANRSQIEITHSKTTIENLLVTNTPVTEDSIYVHDNGELEVTNGLIDGNVTIDTGGRLKIINTTHGPLDVKNGSYEKKWYFKLSVKDNEGNYLDNVDVVIRDNEGGTTYISDNLDQTKTYILPSDYINETDTRTTNYSVSLSYMGEEETYDLGYMIESEETEISIVIPESTKSCQSIGDTVQDSFGIGVIAILVLAAALVVTAITGAFGGNFDYKSIYMTVSVLIVSSLLYIIGVILFAKIQGVLC